MKKKEQVWALEPGVQVRFQLLENGCVKISRILKA